MALAIIKHSLKRVFKEEVVYFSLQFKEQFVHHGRDARAEGAGGSCSHSTHSKETESKGGLHTAAQFPFSIYMV